MLFDGEGKIGAALHGGVVSYDHHLVAVYRAHAGYDPGAGCGAVVHALGCQGGEFQKRRTLIEQGVNALARQQLATAPVQRNGPFAPTFACLAQRVTQAFRLLQIVRHVALEVVAVRVHAGLQDIHRRGSFRCEGCNHRLPHWGTSRRRNASA